MEYDNTNRGVIFLQDAETERHPNFGGSINVDGKEYYLSGWSKTSQNNKKYISLSVKEKQAENGQNSTSNSPSAKAPDDNIPF